MTACKMCSVDITMAGARNPLGQSRNSGWGSCSFVNTSFSPPISNVLPGQGYAIHITCRFGNSLSSSNRLLTLRNEVFHKESSSSWERNFFLMLRRVPFYSFRELAGVPLIKGPRKLQCKAEAQISDASLEGNGQTSPADRQRKADLKARERLTADELPPSIASSPAQSRENVPFNLAVGVGVTAAIFMMAFLGFMAKPRSRMKGSVSDLVKRGQLRSDRGGMRSDVLLYEDPFDNPLVKRVKQNPLVKMCGKVFRLAPVTLTDEKVTEHQNRRIQAYGWKRPTVFLNEGDPVPEGVDSEEVRWIPSNHPFATTNAFIDEDLAQKNVYQMRGVPSRIRAEHEALRKKVFERAQAWDSFHEFIEDLLDTAEERDAYLLAEADFQVPNLDQASIKTWKSADGTYGNASDSSGSSIQGTDSAIAISKQEETP